MKTKKVAPGRHSQLSLPARSAAAKVRIKVRVRLGVALRVGPRLLTLEVVKAGDGDPWEWRPRS